MIMAVYCKKSPVTPIAFRIGCPIQVRSSEQATPDENRFMRGRPVLPIGLDHESEGVAEGSHAALWRFQVSCYYGLAGCAGGSTGAAGAGAGVVTGA
jgi:hypothetical protein